MVTVKGQDLRQPPSPARAAAELRWSQLRTAAPLRPVVVPGTEIPATLRVLSTSEVQLAVARAVRRFAEIELPTPAQDMTFSQDFEDEVCCQLLWAALRDAEDPALPSCPTADLLRDSTTVAQRVALYGLYRDVEDQHDPDPERLDADTIRELELAVKKKDPTSLRSFGSTTLATYMLSSDALLQSLVSGSSGSSPSAEKSPQTS